MVNSWVDSSLSSSSMDMLLLVLFDDDDDLTLSSAIKGKLVTSIISLNHCPSALCTLAPKHLTTPFSVLSFNNFNSCGWHRKL